MYQARFIYIYVYTYINTYNIYIYIYIYIYILYVFIYVQTNPTFDLFKIPNTSLFPNAQCEMKFQLTRKNHKQHSNVTNLNQKTLTE